MSNAELAKRVGVSAAPTLLAVCNGDEAAVERYEGEFKAGPIGAWLERFAGGKCVAQPMHAICCTTRSHCAVTVWARCCLLNMMRTVLPLHTTHAQLICSRIPILARWWPGLSFPKAPTRLLPGHALMSTGNLMPPHGALQGAEPCAGAAGGAPGAST